MTELRPQPPADPLRDELRRAIDRTFQSESLKNEVAIAWVRLVAFAGVAGTEIWYWAQDSGVPWFFRSVTFAYLLVSVMLLVALRRGWYPPWLRIGLPLLDATVVLVRLQSTFTNIERGRLEQVMELATVTLAASLLIVSGGFRLARASLVTCTVSGVLLYYWFALQTRLDVPQLVVHGILLLGVAATTTLLTQQVLRAVRSEVARVTLARFLPTTLIDGLHDDPVAFVTQPRATRATVLVSDIRGFTAWAESRSPIEVLSVLNVVQGQLAAVVREHHGMVDKFMGDGLLAVFGFPEPRDDHAEQAVQAAIAMQEAVAALGDRAGDGLGGFDLGVAVHTGEVVVGCLGSGLDMEFTVLGDTVNTTSRLERLTKDLALPVLVSGTTVAARGSDGLERVADVRLPGRTELVDVWRWTE